MQDPLALTDQPAANSIRAERAMPLESIARLHRRITNPDCADSVEMRVLLLAHLNYSIYTDLKESIAR